MRNAIALILVSFILLGCAKTGCVDPFVKIDDICCRDDDSSGVCDLEEAATAEEISQDRASEPETPVQEPTQEVPEPADELPEVVPTETVTPKPLQAEAKLIVNRFAQAWQGKQYSIMYSLLVPKLQKIKTVEEFKAIMELNPSNQKVEQVKVKDITFESDTVGKVSLEFTTNVKSYETADTTVRFEDGWKIDGMVDVFYVDTFGASCGGYSKEFNRQSCAKDLAVKLKDPSYCERSVCHYTDCMTGIKGSLTKDEKVIACNLCPPLGMTNKECITDVAIGSGDIKVCLAIPESSYADRYCKCYGGYARSKGSDVYCNMITDPEYKDLCLKGFQGKLC